MKLADQTLLMLFTLNPKQESMKIVSIPRDTYTEIVGKGKKR